MNLTAEQRRVIRNAVIDDAAFDRIIQSLETSTPSSSSHQQFLPGLALDHIELVSVILNTLPIPIYIKDRDSRFVLANQATADLMQCVTPQDLNGKTDFDFTQPSLAKTFYQTEQEIIRTGNPILEKELFLPEYFGGPKWYLYSKSPIRNPDNDIVGLIGITINISKQKSAEQSLEHERNLLKTIIDNIEDKIYIKDRESRFVLANRATYQAHQTTHEKLMGTTDFDYIEYEFASILYEQEQDLMETGNTLLNQEAFTSKRILNDLGTETNTNRWFFISKVPIYDESGNVIGLVGINKDITNHKLAKLKDIELRLEQERGHILADFITHSSHEFRTPLSVIQTAIYLSQNTDPSLIGNRHLDQIKMQTQRLSHLIDDLMLMLKLDRQPELNKYNINICSALQPFLTQFDNILNTRNITLTVDELDNMPVISGDHELLGIAFREILENAIRYSQENSTISVSYDVVDDKIAICIADTGIGIAPRTIARLFERFYRADIAHTTTGLGLGLSIARRIVELHHGEIVIDSELNVGTRVKIFLPYTTVSHISDSA